VPPAPIPYIWTGCYVGGNVGGAWSNVEIGSSTGGSASPRLVVRQSWLNGDVLKESTTPSAILCSLGLASINPREGLTALGRT
jgi:hypothetical protein